MKRLSFVGYGPTDADNEEKQQDKVDADELVTISASDLRSPLGHHQATNRGRCLVSKAASKHENIDSLLVHQTVHLTLLKRKKKKNEKKRERERERERDRKWKEM